MAIATHYQEGQIKARETVTRALTCFDSLYTSLTGVGERSKCILSWIGNS